MGFLHAYLGIYGGGGSTVVIWPVIVRTAAYEPITRTAGYQAFSKEAKHETITRTARIG